MTSDCEADLTCFDMTCMNIPFSNPGQACTMDFECGKIYGEEIGECRNMMCGFIPAYMEGEFCDYGYECEEGTECRDEVC